MKGFFVDGIIRCLLNDDFLTCLFVTHTVISRKVSRLLRFRPLPGPHVVEHLLPM